jgi:ParB-like chromosome segregation protein Spo0J
MGKTLCEVFMAEERKQKLHEPVLDHNGNPFSPAQILALERAELTRIRVLRDSMVLAERREQLIEMDTVIRQAAAMFAACRAKLLQIPYDLAHKLEGKDHRAIHELLTQAIHKTLTELADFDKKVIRSDWQPGSTGDPFLPAARSVKRRIKTPGTSS